MMFLTRGATYPGLPFEFAYPAAFGDLLTAIIALVTIPIMLRGSAFAKAAVWFFNIFGTVDLVVAIIHATIYDAPATMGPAYWIPAFWVPLLLVTPPPDLCSSRSTGRRFLSQFQSARVCFDEPAIPTRIVVLIASLCVIFRQTPGWRNWQTRQT